MPEVYLVTLVYLVIIVYLVILVYLAYLVIMLMFTFSLFMPCYLYLFLCWKSLGLTQSLWLTRFVLPLFIPFPPRFVGWEYSLVRILPSSKALSCKAWISLGYGLLCFIGEYCSLFLCFFVFEQDRYFDYVIGYWKLMGFYCKQLYLIRFEVLLLCFPLFLCMSVL